MLTETDFIVPDWPAPENVRAFCTTRSGGVSESVWQSLNLGDHVGDQVSHVQENRRRLAGWAGVSEDRFSFLKQVHKTEVVRLPQKGILTADGCYSREQHAPCLIMTADCLPVLFCDVQGTQIAAAHAGWRGLCDGVLERVAETFDRPENVLAWLGPAIGPMAFEVGPEVREAFAEKDAVSLEAFTPVADSDRWMGDLCQLARQRLANVGISRVYGGQWCTYSDSDRFFSYRRDGVTGRMASLIYLK